MRDSRKLLLRGIGILLLTAGIWCLTVRCYYRSELYYDQDLPERQEMAGNTDFLICGASGIQRALIPEVLDRELGCVSYNLSDTWQNLIGTRLLLTEELDRNPVKTVVLAVTADTFRRDDAIDGLQGDLCILPRLETPGERLCYVRSSVAVKDLPKLSVSLLQSGRDYLLDRLLGRYEPAVDRQAKGYNDYPCTSVRYTDEEVRALYASEPAPAEFREENVREFDAILELLRSRDVEILVIGTPLPDARLWYQDGWDVYADAVRSFLKERGLEYYDLNLLRSRQAFVDDERTCSDIDHLGNAGAEALTPIFAELVRAVRAGEDVTPLFYAGYSEMLRDTDYWKILKR